MMCFEKKNRICFIDRFILLDGMYVSTKRTIERVFKKQSI